MKRMRLLALLLFALGYLQNGVNAQAPVPPPQTQAQEPGKVEGVSARGFYEHFRRTRIQVSAPFELQGQLVTVREGKRVWATTTLRGDDQSASAQLVLPLPTPGQFYGPLEIWVNGKPATTLLLPDFEKERQALVEETPLAFSSFVFAGVDFPTVDFGQPSLMEDVLGPYTLQTTFYDAHYNRVTHADVAGRYGAVVQVTPQVGEPFQRTFTLYRQSAPVDWSQVQTQFSAELPPEVGVQPEVLVERGALWSRFLKDTLADSLSHNPEAGVLLAGLHEAKVSDGSGSWNNPYHSDETWWYGLKKKLGQVKPTRYLLDVPEDYNANKNQKWPLVIFLHGSGESGKDLNMVRRNGLPRLVAQGQHFPFVLVSPQAPTGYLLGRQIIEVLDEVAAKYRVDTDRVYLTGLSMGGNSTWFTSLEFPERFAAIVPIAATGDPGGAARLKGVPTWYFVGGKDDTMSLERAHQMVAAMKAAGVPYQFTLYPDATHPQTWERAYADPALYKWMLAQKRQH